MSVIGPDRDVVAGPNIDLGPADVLIVAHSHDPGRYLIAINGEVPVLPREEAVQRLEEHGFAVAASARADARTDEGWTQVAAALWTAPCQPTVRSAKAAGVTARRHGHTPERAPSGLVVPSHGVLFLSYATFPDSLAGDKVW